MKLDSYETVALSIDDKIARVTLNRPEIHNAFNEVMIGELLEVFRKLKDDEKLRVVILTGEGKSFCAGADIHWMKKMRDYTYEENVEDALALANLMYEMFSFPKPLVGRINGAAIGGGTGLVSVCDIGIAAEDAKFSFSEVKIGLVPACISPYIVERVGFSKANQLFLTGERFDAHRALHFGLVDEVVPSGILDSRVNTFTEQLISSGPEALATAKKLLRDIPYMSLEEQKRYSAEVLAKLRISDEGQEGLAAFLEKRKPKWAE
ncbi:MAG: enoyl-CoA hydratase/isomerase family protein [Candidatus Zixiibacteriota bacterium]